MLLEQIGWLTSILWLRGCFEEGRIVYAKTLRYGKELGVCKELKNGQSGRRFGSAGEMTVG